MPLTGGNDAGLTLIPYYNIARQNFPVLAEQVEILTDTQVGTFGLAWYRGMDTRNTSDPHDDEPRFAVRDDIDVGTAPYVGFHESGHAFQETVARLIALKRNADWMAVFDEIRTRYWSFRGFPGTWQEAQIRALTEKGWGWYPDESFADCFAHVVLHLHPIDGYVTGEWTWNYDTTPIWQRADEATAFMKSLATEAGGEELAFKDDPDAQAFAKDVRDSLEAIKQVLGTQAHHKHRAETGEPEAA